MLSPLRLLLVHPVGTRAQRCSAALARAGHVVMGPVSTGEEAIAACARLTPDLVLAYQSLGTEFTCERLVTQLWRMGPVTTIVLLDESTPPPAALIAAQPLALVPAHASDTELTSIVSLAGSQRTALQQAREPDERFFSVAIDMLCFLDFSGYFRRLSPSWERTLGFTRDELMSRPFIEWVHPDDRERTLAQNRVVRSGGRAVGFENRYLCKDGSYRWFRWNAAPDLEHNVIYSVARDITDAKRDHDEREQLIAELQQALAEVTTLREIIPICSYCKKVRDDDDYWQHVEAYIHTHTGARFSHGVCPGCLESFLQSDVPEST